MTENAKQKNTERRCQAITATGHRCRNRSAYYRIYEGDGLEYLCCTTHFQFFTPHPSQQGHKPED